jgi:sugar lactone lactonase YvrE
MSLQAGRYVQGGSPQTAHDWALDRLTPPSRLFGANGLRNGPDGRLYVAQVSGSQISAIDIDTGEVEAVCPMGGDIVGPDDLAFDSHGNLYITEITEGRVSMRAPDGSTRVLRDDVVNANPITVHAGRLFVGECHPAGRILELDLDGGAPRVILKDVPMPNAMEVGPDGKLYIPIMGTNEIWRVDPAGGTPEVVARDLGVPDAVKFDAQGQIVSTQVASGQVLHINPQNGDRTVLASIAPGLDNLCFVGKRLFVSSISGQVNEIVAPGSLRPLIADGLQLPLGLAMGPDGLLFVADGGFTYTLKPGSALQPAGMLFTPGFPGYTRGVAATTPGEYVVTTANGQVSRWRPASQASEVLASDFDQLMGVAITPRGAAIVAESGTGRVVSVTAGKAEELARGLAQPAGLALDREGNCLVAESGSGRVVRLRGARAETVVDGLQCPHGIAVRDGTLYVLDAAAREVVEFNMDSGKRRSIAGKLPVGAPPGVTRKYLGPIRPFSGPMIPFAGLAAAADGSLFLSADAEGSVMTLRPR